MDIAVPTLCNFTLVRLEQQHIGTEIGIIQRDTQAGSLRLTPLFFLEGPGTKQDSSNSLPTKHCAYACTPKGQERAISDGGPSRRALSAFDRLQRGIPLDPAPCARQSDLAPRACVCSTIRSSPHQHYMHSFAVIGGRDRGFLQSPYQPKSMVGWWTPLH